MSGEKFPKVNSDAMNEEMGSAEGSSEAPKTDWDVLMEEAAKTEGMRSEEEYRQMYPQLTKENNMSREGVEDETDEAYQQRLKNIILEDLVATDESNKAEATAAAEAYAQTAEGKYEAMIQKRAESGDLKPEEAQALFDKLHTRQEQRTQEQETAAMKAEQEAAKAAKEAAEKEAKAAAKYDKTMGILNDKAKARLAELRERRNDLENLLANNVISQSEFDGQITKLNADIAQATQEVGATSVNYGETKARQEYEAAQDAARQEMIEKVAANDPEAMAFLEKHPELKDEMIEAAKKYEELKKAEAEGASASGEAAPSGSAAGGEAAGAKGEYSFDDSKWEEAKKDGSLRALIAGRMTELNIYASALEQKKTAGEISEEEYNAEMSKIEAARADQKAKFAEALGFDIESEQLDKMIDDEVNALMGREAEGEAAEDKGEKLNDSQEKAAKGLAALFSKNKRVKNGKMAGWKKVVLGVVATAIALGVLANPLNTLKDALNKNNVPADNQPTVESQIEDQEQIETDNFEFNNDLSVGEDAEKLNPDLVDGHSYGEEVQFDLGLDGYDGESIFFSSEKHGSHNLTAPLYDMENADSMTNVEIAKQGMEGLAENLDDPILQAQFAALGGEDVVIDGDVNGINSFADMENVLFLSQSDDEFRQTLAVYSQDMLKDMAEKYDIQLEQIDEGDLYWSLYAMNVSNDDGKEGTDTLKYFIDKDVTAKENFMVLQAYNEEGVNVFDSNEIGGYKYNFMKAVGLIPEGASDEEAQQIMSKYEVKGISLRCGQIILTDNPDSGSEPTGSEPTGSEPTGSEPTGSEPTGSEPTGSEPTGSEPTGSEPTGSEPTGSEPTGSEPTGAEPTGAEPTGAEPTGAEPTGAEPTGAEPTGSEPTGAEPTGSEPTGVEPTGAEPTGIEVTPKTETIDDDHNQVLDLTEIEDNTGIIERTDENDASNNEAGSEVTTKTEGEQERGDAAGADAIRESQGVTDDQGNALVNQDTGGQVVNEDRNGDNTATEQQIKDNEAGVASNYTGDDQQSTSEQYGDGEDNHTEADNAQRIDTTPTEESKDAIGNGENTNYSDDDLAAIFNNN